MTEAETEFLRGRLLAKCAEEHRLSRVAVEALPDDKLDWRPDAEKAWTAGALAEHMVTAGSFFVAQVTGKHSQGDPPPPATTKAELLRRITASEEAYTSFLREQPASKLGADLDFGGQTFPAIEVLSWHPWHMVHHRGQLLLYLRLMGAKVPSTYGPSGDEEWGG